MKVIINKRQIRKDKDGIISCNKTFASKTDKPKSKSCTYLINLNFTDDL